MRVLRNLIYELSLKDIERGRGLGVYSAVTKKEEVVFRMSGTKIWKAVEETIIRDQFVEANDQSF